MIKNVNSYDDKIIHNTDFVKYVSVEPLFRIKTDDKYFKPTFKANFAGFSILQFWPKLKPNMVDSNNDKVALKDIDFENVMRKYLTMNGIAEDEF